MRQRILVALGSNLGSRSGDPAQTLRAALHALGDSGLNVVRLSRLFRTPCFPPGTGPDYVNACAVLRGPGTATEVLDRLHSAESDFGRERLQRWGSRSLDLDLLAVEGQVLPDAATQDAWRALPPAEQIRRAPDCLILPHPRLQDRGFVLVPLADVAPDWTHPRTGLTVRQMRDALPPEALEGIAPL